MNEKENNSKLHYKIVRGIDSITELSEDWDSLFDRAHKAPSYFSRAWVQTFMTEKCVKGKPLLITVWSGTKLVALLPLTICSYFGIKVAKIVPTTTLCYTGILIDPNYHEAIQIVVQSLLQKKMAHALYNKYMLSLDEPTNELFTELSRNNFTYKRWKRHVCLKSYSELDFDHLLKKTRNSKQRKKLLYHERQVFKSGDVKVTRYLGKQITQDTINRIADIQIHSWLKEEGKAVLVQPFYKKLLCELAQADVGCIWLMTLKNEDIAFIYCLRAHDTLSFKWMSYKLNYGSSTLSFGKALYTQVIRDACDEGIRVIEFGFGEDRWKQHWATDKEYVNLAISGRDFIGYLAAFICGMLLKCAQYRWKLHQYIKKIRMAIKKKHLLNSLLS
jgi:CelD/BcsL family acetyltransferase involved in cellulose biosynthesis